MSTSRLITSPYDIKIGLENAMVLLRDCQLDRVSSSGVYGQSRTAIYSFHKILLSALRKGTVNLSKELYEYKNQFSLICCTAIDSIYRSELDLAIDHLEFLDIIRNTKWLEQDKPAWFEDANTRFQTVFELIRRNKKGMANLTRNDTYTAINFLETYAHIARTLLLSNEGQAQSEKIDAIAHDCFGHAAYRLGHDVLLEITPIDAVFQKKPLAGCVQIATSDGDGSIQWLNTECLRLGALHLTDVSMQCYLHGFTGDVTFEMAMPSNFCADEFLKNFSDHWLQVQLTLSTQIKDDIVKKEHRPCNSTNSFLGFSDGTVSICTKKRPLVKSKQEENERAMPQILQLKLQFMDPLQAFWKKHHALYVANAVTYKDTFESNLLFGKFAQLDFGQSEGFTSERKQIVVSTFSRSFYDFFMETLFFYKNHLVIDYSSRTENPLKPYTYRICKITPPKEPLKIKEDLFSLDMRCMKYGNMSNGNIMIGDHEFIDLNIKHNSRNKLNVAYKNETLKQSTISSVTPVLFHSTDALRVWEKFHESKKAIEVGLGFLSELSMSSLPISFDPLPSLLVLPSGKFTPELLSQSSFVKTLTIVETSIKVERSDHGSCMRDHSINASFLIDSDKEKMKKLDAIRVISKNFCNYSKITMNIKMSNGMDIGCMYPTFVPFHKFYSEAMVSIGENIPDSKKNAYAFFQGQTPKQGTYTPGNEQTVDPLNYLSSESDSSSTYLLKLPKALGMQDAEPIFHVPVQLHHMGSNRFNPMVNGDIIQLEFQNQETAKITLVTASTSVIALKKGDEGQQQGFYFGARQECALRAESDQSDSSFLLDQTFPEHNESHQLLFSQKKGIHLSFKKETDG